MNNRHVWEGWTVQDFIDELEPSFDRILDNSSSFNVKSFETKEDVKNWCKDNQPYYKKHIPEVSKYFIDKWKKVKGC